MPVFRVNLGESTRGLKTGSYRFEVKSVEERSAKTGKKMAVVQSAVIEPTDFANRRIFTNLVLDDIDSMWAVERFLNACGIKTPQNPEERKSFELDTDALIGRTFFADITHSAQTGFDTQDAVYSEEAWARLVASGTKRLGVTEAPVSVPA